jgi:RNA recognition motif-containing protein
MAVNEETSVYVGGLPYDADEEMLRLYFEPCGTIVSVKVMNPPPPFCSPLLLVSPPPSSCPVLGLA